MNELCLLNLVVTPQVADAVTDWLLEHEAISGFTSLAIAGHGSSAHAMSLAEQVAGKRHQVLFQLHLPLAEARDLLPALKTDFGGSGLHYWLLPVLESGHLD